MKQLRNKGSNQFAIARFRRTGRMVATSTVVEEHWMAREAWDYNTRNLAFHRAQQPATLMWVAGECVGTLENPVCCTKNNYPPESNMEVSSSHLQIMFPLKTFIYWACPIDTFDYGGSCSYFWGSHCSTAAAGLSFISKNLGEQGNFANSLGHRETFFWPIVGLKVDYPLIILIARRAVQPETCFRGKTLWSPPCPPILPS